MDFALWLTGLISGAFHSEAIEECIAEAVVLQNYSLQNQREPESLLHLVVLESMSYVGKEACTTEANQ